MPRARSSYSGLSISGSLPRGVKWLIGINLGVFLVCYLGGESIQRPVSVLLALSAEAAIRDFLIYQVFTYMFVHFGVMHAVLRVGGRRLCPGGQHAGARLGHPHAGRFGRDLRRSGRIWNSLPGCRHPDVLPVPDEGQIRRHHLRRRRIARYLRSQHGSEHGGSPGRRRICLRVPEVSAASAATAGCRWRLPAVEVAARQEEVPGVHAEARRPRTLGELARR
ncbi:hypothetical protein SBA3_850029 [Candidatus Sulfopaludibacter sp. SbA3]|nr:hypothetical protein SBA3_850029 [Candidatus Sulfopaludibacter sp. SbA3]